VQSEPGKGTTVRICLPRARIPVSAAEAPEKAGKEECSGRTVLLVDDDSQVRVVIADMLAELGYGVTPVGSGAEALRRIEKGEAFDILVTDHAMPGMTGSELAARVKDLRPKLGILLVTGYAELVTLPAGTGTVLRKPFNLDQMGAVLNGLGQR
jgi:CheY-like chemotaxis protein